MFKLENSVVILYVCVYMLTCGRRREECIHSNPRAPSKTITGLGFFANYTKCLLPVFELNMPVVIQV